MSRPFTIIGLLLSTVFCIGNTQSDLIYCENLLAKDILSIQDFEMLDSLIFELNYYASEKPSELYRKARAKAWNQNLPKFYLQFDIMLSELFYESDKMDSCSFYVNRAASLAKELGEEVMYARTTNTLRLTHTLKNDYAEGYEVCYEALEIFERHNDIAGMGVANRDIGAIMLLEKKYTDALRYNLKSAEDLEESENWYELKVSYQRLAIIYRNIGDFQRAHENIQKAIVTAKKLKGFRMIQGLTKLIWTEGYIFQAEGKYENALSAFDVAKRHAEVISYDKMYRFYYNSTGSIYLKTQEYEKALTAFQNALTTFESNDLALNGYDYYVPIFSNMVEAYEGLNDFESANYYLKKIAADKDSVFTITSEKQVAELQTKYETTKKEAQISQLESEKLVQKYFILFGGIALSALTFGLFLLFKSNHFRSKTNKILSQQKEEIEEKNKQNEVLLREIHHRVKNNLQTISSLLSLQSESITDTAAYNAVEESKNRVRSMALIHQKLYQGKNLASIEMRNYFQTMGSAIIESFGQKGEKISLSVQMTEIELDVDTAIPIGLITNELLTNSLKYAFNNKEGQISISLTRKDEKFNELCIKDNGKHISKAGKDQEGGFGTMLLQLLTQQLNGTLDIETEEGTVAILKFPVTLKSAV